MHQKLGLPNSDGIAMAKMMLEDISPSFFSFCLASDSRKACHVTAMKSLLSTIAVTLVVSSLAIAGDLYTCTRCGQVWSKHPIKVPTCPASNNPKCPVPCMIIKK